jgi:hypothetical protein
MKLSVVKWTPMVKKDKVVIKWDVQLSLNLIYNTINIKFNLSKYFSLINLTNCHLTISQNGNQNE